MRKEYNIREYIKLLDKIFGGVDVKSYSYQKYNSKLHADISFEFTNNGFEYRIKLLRELCKDFFHKENNIAFGDFWLDSSNNDLYICAGNSPGNIRWVHVKSTNKFNHPNVTHSHEGPPPKSINYELIILTIECNVETFEALKYALPIVSV